MLIPYSNSTEPKIKIDSDFISTRKKAEPNVQKKLIVNSKDFDIYFTNTLRFPIVEI